MGDLGRATDNCFIFDLVIYNGVTRLFDPQSFVKVLLTTMFGIVLPDSLGEPNESDN